ncbi:CU044_2847 family protein [Nodosilinea sp. P-1105]|uniref:CU044_2847 family protein n=1 Tax=Nodosilinea sp. P-1105 TaxID=2546229 RepID=UPI00146E4D43|nr:CU044_2847 family protein [Nodosilinea sp. P-1105]NMF84522.1 hypothetical protein [Nodosilinea sp. P-1105]
MSELTRLLVEDNGTITEIYVEAPPTPPIAEPSRSGTRPGEKGVTDEVLLKMEEIQSNITAYANFAIGAFQRLGGAEVEELNLKFGIKLGGKTGVIFTEGSAEGSMEISVKCKFPPKSPNQ